MLKSPVVSDGPMITSQRELEYKKKKKNQISINIVLTNYKCTKLLLYIKIQSSTNKDKKKKKNQNNVKKKKTRLVRIYYYYFFSQSIHSGAKKFSF